MNFQNLFVPLLEEVLIDNMPVNESNFSMEIVVKKAKVHNFNKVDYSTSHHSKLFCLKINHDSECLISASIDGHVKSYNFIENKEILNYTLNYPYISNILLSNDCKYLAITSENRLFLYDIIKNTEIALISHIKPIKFSLFSPNSMLVISYSSDNTLKIWNISNQKSENVDFQLEENIISLEISENSIYLAFAYPNFTIAVHKILKKKSPIILKGHTEEISFIKFTKDEKFLISASQDYQIFVWDLTNYDQFFQLSGHQSKISCIVLTDCQIFSASTDKTIKEWNISQRNLNFTYTGHLSAVNTIILTVDFAFLISGSDDKSIKIWNTLEKRLEISLYGHNSPVLFVELSLNCNYLASGSYDGSIHMRKIQSTHQKKKVNSHKSQIKCVKVSLNSEYIISSSIDKSLIIWEVIENKGSVILEHNKIINLIEISDDNQIFITACDDFSVILWDFCSRTIKNVLLGHDFEINCLKIAENSNFLVTSSTDSYIKVWDIEENSNIELINNTKSIKFLEFSQNNSFLIVGSEDGRIKIWDFFNGTEKCEVNHSNELNCMAISNNKKFLVTGSNEKSLKIWDLDSIVYNFSVFSIPEQKAHNKNSEFLLFHNDFVTCVSISHDDLYIASGSNDKSVKIWNFTEKIEEISFTGHLGAITMILFSENSYFVASSSSDFTVKLWNIREKRLECSFPEFSHKILSLSFLTPSSLLIFASNSCSLTVHSFEMSSFDCYLNTFSSLSAFSHLITLHTGRMPIASECPIICSALKFNLTHFYSYTGQDKHLKLALNLGCDIREDIKGHSPLHYSIEKNSHTCREVILHHMITLAKKGQKNEKFLEHAFALRRDLENIFKSGSPLIPDFLESIFGVIKNENLPQYIVPKKDLPIFYKSKMRNVDISKFECKEGERKNAVRALVAFRSTPIPFEISTGSKESQKLFGAMLECPNSLIFRTQLIKRLVRFKWDSIRPLIILFTVILWSNLLIMILLITDHNDSIFLNLLYLLINIVLFVQELFQIISFGIEEYIMDIENILDIIRLGSCLIWLVLNAIGKMKYYLQWTMVLCNFIKGIIGFRAFDNTRFYVRLIFTAFKDTYSFIFLICYSTLAFGVLYYSSTPRVKDSIFEDFWIIPYQLSLGQFQPNDNRFDLEYAYFLLASVVNIILMLNLLISILGDSFDKFHQASAEIDIKEMVEVILEIEAIFLWKRNLKDRFYVHLCEELKINGGMEEWEGKIKLLEIKIDKISKLIGNEFENIKGHVDSKFGEIDKKLEKIGKVVGLRKNSY